MPAYNYQPAEVTNFSGGMTDIYVNAPPNRAQILENFGILGNNSIKTRPGTWVDSETDPQIPIGSQRINTLISYNNSEKMFVQAAAKLYFRDSPSWTSLLGPTSNNPFTTDATNHFSHTEWNKHLIICNDKFDKPVKVYVDDNGDYQLRTAGLPRLATSPTVTPTAGANSWLYAFHYAYSYNVGDQLFVDYGPTTIVETTSAATTVAITNIPVLSNGGTGNYDTTNIKVFIFRTINGGKTFFKAGEVTNGTTTFNDSMSDATLQDGEPIYTTGDVPDNDPPPLAKFCHTVNGKTYYAHFQEGSETFPTKYRQSQGFDPDSVPASFEDELEDEITGFSSVGDIPIIGCKKFIYRVEGAFDELGREGMRHVKLPGSAGCISHESMVKDDDGNLFWFGTDGVYVTDGMKVQKVSNHLTTRYMEYVATLRTKKRKIKGTFNSVDNVIHWTLSKETKAEGSEDCDIIWTLDLNFGVSDEMPMHIWLGGDTFIPTSLVFHDGALYRGDYLGYVLKFSSNYVTDPKIDAGEIPENWEQEAIIWKYRSVASNFGTSFVRKIANKILITSKNETNVSIAIKAINDDGKVERDLTPVRWRRNFTWGDDEFIWGNPEFVWSYGGMIEVDRRFPAGGLRFNYLQMEITNDFTNIVNSDLVGTAEVDAVAKTVTLTDAANGDWPLSSVDYVIYFENDNYTKGFTVTSRGDDTLVVSDLNNELVSGTYKWQLKGYKKGEILNLTGYSISWANLTRSHTSFNKGDNGGLE